MRPDPGAILKVYSSEADREALSLTKTVRSTEIAGFEYASVVVNKPWGYEYLMYQNAHVAVWILYLKYRRSTSLHCHVKKKTSLVVLSGEVVTVTLDNSFTRAAFEGIILESSVFHSTRAISPRGAVVMEIETPPDKQDLVRLRDEYGRKSTGYESSSQYSRECDKYDYVSFHESFESYACKFLKGVAIAIHRPSDGNLLFESDNIELARADIVGSYGGVLMGGDGAVILSPGDICKGWELRKTNYVNGSGDLELLTVRRGTNVS
jgi:hypothetical protein